MPPSSDPILKNVRAIAELERATLQQRTRVERLTDVVTETAGSPPFIIAHMFWFVGWMTLNRSTGAAFDPTPFSLLNLMVSLEAIVLTSFVLMTQNRMTKQADKRAHLDLQINLIAEQELTAVLQMLHGLCQKSGVKVSIRDAHVDQLLKETDVQELAGALEAEMPSGTATTDSLPKS
jgi:uncharacterized membrane protein